jgi:hypothetical protein
MGHDPAETPVQSPLGTLERTLIDGFVRSRGHDPDRLHELDPAAREELLKQASIYASSRLAEVEARSHYVHEIHDGGPAVARTGLE